MKCRILLTRAGETTMYDGDVVMIDGRPHAVLEWSAGRTPAEDTPAVTVALEPQLLHPVQGWGEVTHMYEMPVTDPRPLH